MFTKVLQFSFIVVLASASLNPQPVVDWWRLRQYQPDQQISNLADTTQMTPEGRQLFYISRPELNNKQAFNRNCPVAERGQILGCYNDQKIYLLNIQEPKLKAVVPVTAAHEMLHAAYDRLPADEKEQLNQLLQRAFQKVHDQKIRETMAEYERHEPEVYDNELHSVLGTQAKDLPPELETYYGQYFQKRQAVVQQYRSYRGVFEQLENKIENLRQRVQQIRSQLDKLKSQIEAKRAEIEAVNQQLEERRSEGDIAGYNALVPKQNRLVKEHNQLVERYQSLLEEHNRIVKELNNLVLRQQNLVESLDSKQFEELPEG